MKDIKKILAGVMAVSMVMGLAACGDTDEDSMGGDEAVATTTTTTAVTVEINTETLNEEAQAAIEGSSSQLRDYDLENKTIKWLAHYDINPSTSGASKSVPLEYFESKYGGNIQWYPTTWDARYSDLSTYVLGGEGIDFFPCDTAALPKGVNNGMFSPVDDYIDLSSDLWQTVGTAMEIYNFGGKHYEFVVGVSAEEVVLYNKQTLEENNIEDPYERWQNGEWNWDTFKADLISYVDAENEQYGLDGYWAEKALFLSAGVPAVEAVDGHLKANLMDATVEKAMNYGYDLYTNNLIIDRSLFDWAEHPEFMSTGSELYYIVGAWHVQAAPETWATKIDPENLGIAPVPSPVDSENYMAATLDGWCLCKGAANPNGVALYAECNLLAAKDPDAIAIADQKAKDDYGWSDELIAVNKSINEAARLHPVVDLATGVSADVASITTDGGDGIGLRAAFHGVEWAPNRDEISGVVDMLVAEEDSKLNG